MPVLRKELENGSDVSAYSELKGIIRRIEYKGDYVVCLADTGEAFGCVNVYTDESLHADYALRIGCSAVFGGSFFLYDDAGNPGQFSARDYYDIQGIYLAFRADSVSTAGDDYDHLKNACHRIKRYLRENIGRYALLEDRNFFTALATGENREEGTEKQLFNRLGMVSLLSVSGMKILLIGNAIYSLIRRKCSLTVSAVLSVSAVSVYVILTGEGNAAVRALILFMIKVLAPVAKRKFDMISAASLAFILLLAEHPLVMRTAGSWYYAAVLAGTGALAPAVMRCMKRPGKIYESLIRTISAALLILPVKLYFDFCFSPYSVIVSALIIPVLGVLFGTVLCGALLCGFWPGAGVFLFGTGHYLKMYCIAVAEFFGKLPGTEIISGRPSVSRIMIYLAAVAASGMFFRIRFLNNRYVPEKQEKKYGKKGGFLIIFYFMVLYGFGVCILHAPAVSEDSIELVMIDVGQGDGFLLRTRNSDVLIDCGSSDKKNVGEDILIPLLKYYGIHRLDTVFLTHADQDHVNGVADMLEGDEFTVGSLYYPGCAEAEFSKMIHTAEESGTETCEMNSEDFLILPSGEDLTEIRCLWPEKECAFEGNEASLVLRAEYAGNVILFCGDISSAVEEQLDDPGRIRVLKTAHHGSRFSTSDSFLENTKPQIALISYGKNNIYGHPSGETIDRLEAHGVRIYGSGSCGAVMLTIRKNGETEVRTCRAGQ